MFRYESCVFCTQFELQLPSSTTINNTHSFILNTHECQFNHQLSTRQPHQSSTSSTESMQSVDPQCEFKLQHPSSTAIYKTHSININTYPCELNHQLSTHPSIINLAIWIDLCNRMRTAMRILASTFAVNHDIHHTLVPHQYRFVLIKSTTLGSTHSSIINLFN